MVAGTHMRVLLEVNLTARKTKKKEPEKNQFLGESTPILT